MRQSAARVLTELKVHANAAKAEHAQGFFKTGPGEYGEGDKFLGIRVPVQRRIARNFKNLPLDEVLKLLTSKWHEARLTALIILVQQYKCGDEDGRNGIFRLYLDHTAFINGWDLVDSSAHFIVGPHLDPYERGLLDELADSASIWERRIAMISTYHYIKIGEFADALRIAELLLRDDEDLIHKAVGWMLREIGNRNLDAEEAFLKIYYSTMPRTMLRYAIERFPEARRLAYLRGDI